MVALVSILVFTAIGAMLPRIHTGSALARQRGLLPREAAVPAGLVAVTFELQRLFARYCTTGPLRVLLWPGFLVQKITTAEPDDAQLEVALGSLRVTLFRQEQGQTAGRRPRTTSSFPSYEALLAAPQAARRPTAPC